jgi:hypothetical protein
MGNLSVYGAIYTSGNVTANDTFVNNYLFANGVNILSTISTSSIVNGGSQLAFVSSGGNGVFQIGGVQTATFSQTSIAMIGNISATANINGANVIASSGVYGATVNSTGNINVGGFLTLANAIQFANLTTTQINAISPTKTGMTVFNYNTGNIQVWTGTKWGNVVIS